MLNWSSKLFDCELSKGNQRCWSWSRERCIWTRARSSWSTRRTANSFARTAEELWPPDWQTREESISNVIDRKENPTRKGHRPIDSKWNPQRMRTLEVSVRWSSRLSRTSTRRVRSCRDPLWATRCRSASVRSATLFSSRWPSHRPWISARRSEGFDQTVCAPSSTRHSSRSVSTISPTHLFTL